MNYGAERTLVVRILVILVFLGAMGATAALEPDGPVTFRPTWSEPDPAARQLVLRDLGAELSLAVVPDVGLRQAWLELRLPPGIAGGPIAAAPEDDVESELERDGTTVVRLRLGRMDRGVERGMRFRLRLEAGEGAVATFTVVGTDDRGAAVRDACGVVVGTPGGAPDHRHGAVEYRAVPIPDPNAGTP